LRDILSREAKFNTDLKFCLVYERGYLLDRFYLRNLEAGIINFTKVKARAMDRWNEKVREQ
jgi:hypothetical protein